ncbi:MAG: hypothetical protein K6T99_11540 [Armatimonadetes bacterium]|nr:hypothetical protein [Armatimonadota bacterium]
MRYYHFGALGSTRLLTDSDGNITDEYTYDAWGELMEHIEHTGSTDQPYQFVGQLGYYTHVQDANLPLLQLGIRFYDPEVGRFGQRDAIKQVLSIYAYALNEPLVYSDPTGYKVKCVGKGLLKETCLKYFCTIFPESPTCDGAGTTACDRPQNDTTQCQDCCDVKYACCMLIEGWQSGGQTKCYNQQENCYEKCVSLYGCEKMKKRSWSTVFLLLAVVLLFWSGCRNNGVKVDKQGDNRGCKRDSVRHLNPVMQDYTRALELYKAGRIEEGIALVRKLSTRELRLRPESAYRDYDAFTHYYASQVMPAMWTLREIYRRNREHAAELSRTGKQTLALQVLLVNLDIARQIVHAQVPNTLEIINGTALWLCTWKLVAKELEALGDMDSARAATSCSKAARRFVDRHITPVVDKGKRHVEQIKKLKDKSAIAKMEKDMLQEDLRDSYRLIELWDKEILSTECKQLIRKLKKKK